MVDGRWAVRLRLLAMMLLLGAPAVWGQDFREAVGHEHQWGRSITPTSGPSSGGTRLVFHMDMLPGVEIYSVTFDGGTALTAAPGADWGDVSKVLVLEATPPHSTNQTDAVMVQVLADGAPFTSFTFLYYGLPNVTGVLTKAGAIYGSGAVSASMYGGERVQLEGRFFLPTDEPLIRLTSANMSKQLVLPVVELGHNYSVRDTFKFYMERYILPERFPWVLLNMELSMNGVDFVPLPFFINVTSALAPMKVCMMFNLRADGTPGWSYATNVARLRLQETLGSVVQIQTAEMINPSNLNATVLAFAADGCKMIIGIHITHRQAYRALVGTEYEGSGIKFVVGGEFALNAVEAGVSTDDVGVCFPKLYESRFLSGLMAGYMTRTGVIGYVISVTIPQTLRQANAFMMGVRRAHPTATVLLYGTGTWAPDGMFSQGNLTWKSDLLVGKLLLRQGADIITQHTNGLGLSSLVHNASTAEEPRYTLGVWSNMGATLGDHVLVSALNVWAPCFLDYARQVLYNEWSGQQGKFEGLGGGYSDLSPISPRVPLEVQAKVLAAREELLIPGSEIFCGDEDGIPSALCAGGECQPGEFLVPPQQCLDDNDIESAAIMSVERLYPGLVWKGMFTAPNCTHGTHANYSADFATFACDVCPPGAEAPSPYEDECVRCQVGSRSRDGRCEPCPAGSFSDAAGASMCMPCAPGQEQLQEGQAACDACAPGFFSPGGGAECSPCPPDSYNPLPGQSKCSACPANTVAAFLSATQLQQCRCRAGFYVEAWRGVAQKGGEPCAACPFTRLAAGTFVDGTRSRCERMQPCNSVEQGLNLTFAVFVETVGSYDEQTRHVCGLDTEESKEVVGQFATESADGYATTEVVFDRLMTDMHDDDEPGVVVRQEYTWTTAVTTKGWFLFQVTVDGVPATFSPLMYNVKTRTNCPSGTMATDVGECRDSPIKLRLAPILGALFGGLAALALLVYFAYWRNQQAIRNYLRNVAMLRQPPRPGQPVTIVITDIEGSTALWDQLPVEMNEALATHDMLLRSLMRKHHGYELLTEGDSFHVAFHRPEHALQWCMAVQLQLYNHKWSDAIVEATKHPECDKFYGLRVRAGMHSGVVDQVTVHPNTKRVQYTGALLAVAKAVQGAAAGGQVLMSGDTLGQISSTEALDTDVVSYEDQTKRFMVHLGQHQLAVKVMETAAPHPAEVAVDVVKRKRSSVKEEYLSDEAQMQNSHEIVMVLPGSLRERETHFPPIKTDTQVSPSFYDAPAHANVTIVFTYIERLDELMAASPEAGAKAVATHNSKLRALLLKYNGYECREQDGQFLLAFHSATDAVQWGMDVQETLLCAAWSDALLEMPAACRMMVSNCMIFRGLRVQVGIVSGAVLEMKPCKRTGRAEYFGPQLNKAARIANAAHGGQILIGRCAFQALDPRVMQQLSMQSTDIGKYSLKGVAEPELIHQMASGRMLLRPFTSIKAKKKQWYHHVRPSPKSTAASSPTAAGVSGEDEAVSRLTHADSRETHAYSQEDEESGEMPQQRRRAQAMRFSAHSSSHDYTPQMRGSGGGDMSDRDAAAVCVYVDDVTLETSLKRALTAAGCVVTTVRYMQRGADDPDHVAEVLRAASRAKVFATTAGPAGRQAAFQWFATLKKELDMHCPALLFVGHADECASAVLQGVVPLTVPFTPADVTAALQAVGTATVQQLLTHAAELQPMGGDDIGSSDRGSGVERRSAGNAMSNITSHHSFRSFTNTTQTHNSNPEDLAPLAILLLTNSEVSDSNELTDPFLRQFKRRAERRSHTMQLVFSLEDAKRILTASANNPADQSTLKPTMVLIDEKHTLKLKETLPTLREFDTKRMDLMLVVLMSDANTNDKEMKMLYELGADLLYTAGLSECAMDSVFRSAEKSNACAAFHMQARVLTHALQEVAHAVDLANVNGAVLWVNAAYEQLTGFEFDEAHGRQLDFLEHSDAPQMAVAITRVVRTGVPWVGRVTIVSKAGKLIPHMCAISLVPMEDDRAPAYIACVRTPLATTQPPTADHLTAAVLLDDDAAVRNGSATQVSLSAVISSISSISGSLP